MLEATFGATHDTVNGPGEFTRDIFLSVRNPSQFDR